MNILHALDKVESYSKGAGADEVVSFRDVSSVPDDTSRWVEGTVSTTGEPWLEVPVLLFYTGTHKGETYTRECLQKMASQLVEPKGERDWDVPGQLDHSESSRDTVAHLRKAWVEGDQLWGVARFIGADEVRNVKNGKWRKISLSVFKKSRRMREFSILPFPHLTEASVHSQSTNPESEERMADKATTTEAPKETEETKATPQAEEKPTESFAQAAMQAQLAQFAETTRRLAEAEAEKKALAEKNAQLERANAEKDQVIRFAAVTAEIDKFSAAGKILPAQRETQLALVQTFSSEQMDLWRKAIEATPGVDLAVHGSQDADQVDTEKAKRESEETGVAEYSAADVGKALAERFYTNHAGKDGAK